MSTINPIKIKDLYESRKKQSNGVKRFVIEMRNMLGLCDAEGNDYKDASGNRLIKDKKIDAGQFSLKALAEGMFGDKFYDTFNPTSAGTMSRHLGYGDEVANSTGNKLAALEEGVGAPLDPSAFININAYSILTGGLIEVRILEGFQNPAFIGDKLMKTIPTRLNGQKIINVNPNYPAATKRQPGQEFPRTQFGQRWIETPETRELSLAIDVTREAVFFDLTNSVLQNASQIGEEVGYQKELDILNTVIAASVGSLFNWKGQNYAVYSDLSSTLGYNSLLASNGLVDWVSLQNAMTQLYRNVDPDTRKRILINPNAILLTQSQVPTANLILNATMTQRRTGTGATPAQTTSMPLNVSDTAGSPFYKQFEVLTSPLLEQQLIATGVAANLAAANNLWFLMDTTKAFAYMQNSPLTVNQATATDYALLNQGLISSYFAFERGIPAIFSPWHLLKCTG